MELYDGEQKQKEGQGKKIVAILIAVLVCALVILLAVIVAINQSIDESPKINVDGKKYKIPSGFMIAQEGNLYVSISNLASYVGYKSYNGEYREYTEDRTKGYVECEDEITSFSADSNIIYKSNAKDKSNFDSEEITLPIISQNNILYASVEDAGKIFNLQIFYRQTDNTLVVYTLPYLVSYYKDEVKEYGYDDLSEEFNTQKAIANNMLVVKKDDKYGVISSEDFSSIIGARYDSMVYLESTQEFIVTSEGKTGLISTTGENKIRLIYDDIGLIDTEYRLYYAKSNNLMGVLNGNGRVLVYLDYNSLGFEREEFTIENIKHNMLLFENCIPTMKYETREELDSNGKTVTIYIKKWGLADKLGNILLNNEYDSFGYIEDPEDRSINNVVIIPKIKGIVIGKNNKYGVIDSIGRMIIPCEYDRIYSITNEGNNEYYLEKDGITIRLEKYITDNKIQVYEEENEGTTNNTNNNTNTNVNNTTTNTLVNGTTNELNTTNNTTNTSTNQSTGGGLVVIPM